MANYYLSKNYTDISSAGNKAKTDIEKILSGLGYKSAGLAQTVYSNKIAGFILTLIGVLRMFFTLSANDVVVIQYPFKKYYSFACRIAHFKKGKVITVVHDLGVFRRKRLSVDEEMARLSHTDYLIVHNESMKNWLLRHGYSKPMVSLSIFDYLSSSVNTGQDTYGEGPIKVIYAGGLSYKKNRYLYALDDIISNWQFELYGSGFEEDKIKNKKQFKYHGFCPSDRLIETVSAHYGLVWDGESASACSGNYGEYLKINNPHKASLYIRCNLPVIIWKEAALAPFVMKHKIGLCIGSIDELNTTLPAVSVEEYNEMKRNIRAINANLSSGFYLTNALSLIESLAR
ncbi:MAG: galactofuranosyltransferase [Tannerellaceae bacterium]|jgi:hypothetical protein|nr:galactofuranosyltransferase [Tannerellaceae bacterium]